MLYNEAQSYLREKCEQKLCQCFYAPALTEISSKCNESTAIVALPIIKNRPNTTKLPCSVYIIFASVMQHLQYGISSLSLSRHSQ